MKKHKILLVCGTGIATSTVAAQKIQEALNEKGIRVELEQCKALEIKSKVDSFKPSVIISTTNIIGDFGVPVIKGTPFLTGIGVEQVINQIISELKK